MTTFKKEPLRALYGPADLISSRRGGSELDVNGGGGGRGS